MPDINATQMRDALAWATNEQPDEDAVTSNPWEWFWQAVQGDFNDNRSTGQIVVDAAISMIPFVDQICDVRDLIANCKKLYEDITDTWAWVALVLTLIGLVPFIGSAIKGALKVFFAFVRRAGEKAVEKAVEEALTWVVALLRRKTFQKYLRAHNIDEVFSWVAKEIKNIQAKLSPGELLKVFDKAIGTIGNLAKKVEDVPLVGAKAEDAYKKVVWVRSKADKKIADVNSTVNAILDKIVIRLEKESRLSRHGIVNVNNIHYRGALPASAAVSLMRNSSPKPSWLSSGSKLPWSQLKFDNKIRAKIQTWEKQGWPALEKYNVESFHRLIPDEIKGPAKLYRILSPNSRAMSDCWVSEKIFNDLQNSPNPREAWRKFLAVWPDWNVNGQFVVYDVKPGEALKVWRGPASSQTRNDLPDQHLEGGLEQIVFKLNQSDPRNDTMRFYKLGGGNKNILRNAIDQNAYYKLSAAKRNEYLAIRENINHPNISGPFDTGWGYTDFEGNGFPHKIGLPALPGQVSSLAN